MLFTTLTFILFFAVVCFCWHIVPAKFRNAGLLTVNILFCGLFAVKYVLVLLCVVLLSYGLGLLLEKTAGRRRLVLSAGLCLLFAPLVLFKYTDFLLTAAGSVIGVQLATPGWIAPVGVSFYTFQAAGYVIDIFRGEKAERNIVTYGSFASFFLTISSGPIERRGNLLAQLKEKQPFSCDQLRRGLLLAMWGYFLKTIVADHIGRIVDPVFADPAGWNAPALIAAMVLYAFQLYCDFASYSQIARGLGLCMGLRLTDNFNTPYFAASVGEFWRRWHISLSTWFRDYLYIPMGGNRRGPWRKRLNAFTVMLVSGIWHGVGWQFIVWGALHGIYQLMGDMLKPLRERVTHHLRIDSQHGPARVLRCLITFVLVDIGWVFFRCSSVSDALVFLKGTALHWTASDSLLGIAGLCTDIRIWLLVGAGLFLLLLVSCLRFRGQDPAERFLSVNGALRFVLVLLMMLTILVFGVWGAGYDASSFIYFQF